ncbi:MAG: hypothetical protein ACYS9T_10070 [Planctomycetota bacterium]|jgi:hypothetical protein
MVTKVKYDRVRAKILLTARRIKYGKVLAVIFLTVLIWVWADLAKTQTWTVSGATISVAKPASFDLWVTFQDYKPLVPIEKIELKGSTSKIDRLKRQIRVNRLSLKFFYTPEPPPGVGPQYSLDVLDFLRKSDQIQELGLMVESCKPDIVTVNVVELVERSLAVECFDENGSPVRVQSVDPAKVDMLVPKDWAGPATVLMTRGDIEMGRGLTIEKIPYIKLSGGQLRKADTVVKVTMPQDTPPEQTIPTPRLGFAFGENLQGQYKVELENWSEVIGLIRIKATPDAKRAYENMRWQVILEIEDDDLKLAEPRRPLKYNFPEEYLRRNEIELIQPRVEARFKLIPQASIEAPSVPPE